MKILVGLGNPDARYENTYHNLGFMAIDKCAEILGATFNKQKFRALIAEINLNGEKVILVKPQTYMNLSGECVREITSFYKIDLSNLIVVYDDFDLELGALRIRENGSAGTHNGMRNIVAQLSSCEFPRIRVGFKPKTCNMPLIDLVLSGIKSEDRPIIDGALDSASKALVLFAKGEAIGNVMQRYNKKSTK